MVRKVKHRGADRVLTIRATGKTDPADIVPAAKGVAREVRRLRWEGYDLTFFEVRAHVLLDGNTQPRRRLVLTGRNGQLRER